VKEEQVMELNQQDIIRIKKMIYEGKADICYFLHRSEVKALIKISEEYFKEKK